MSDNPTLPIQPNERISALDVLRGFALVGLGMVGKTHLYWVVPIGIVYYFLQAIKKNAGRFLLSARLVFIWLEII